MVRYDFSSNHLLKNIMEQDIMQNKEKMDEMIAQDEFVNLIETMDLPDFRKSFSTGNVRWFIRNAQINNHNHPNIDIALKKAKKLLKYETEVIWNS